MKVLVTGANGYLGRGIINELIDKKIEVIATDFKTDHVNTSVECINCNLFDVEDPYTTFNKPDVLLHLAWRDGFVHYSDAHIEDLSNHYTFIKKMINAGLKKVVVLGSMHEIGFFEGSIDENTPCHPVTPYGISKNALRELTTMLCKQNNTTFQWLRGFYIVGNVSYGNSIFSKIVSAIEKKEKTFPFTMGQNQFDFVDYDLFCKMVAKTIIQDKINGIINLCSGKPEKLADRVERFIKDNNYDIKLQYGAFPDRPYDSKAVWGNNSKIDLIMNSKI